MIKTTIIKTPIQSRLLCIIKNFIFRKTHFIVRAHYENPTLSNTEDSDHTQTLFLIKNPHFLGDPLLQFIYNNNRGSKMKKTSHSNLDSNKQPTFSLKPIFIFINNKNRGLKMKVSTNFEL